MPVPQLVCVFVRMCALCVHVMCVCVCVGAHMYVCPHVYVDLNEPMSHYEPDGNSAKA